MKNNKSLIWALAGLLIIIIVGVYVYQTDPFAEPDATETAQQGETGSEPAATGDEEKTAAAQPDNNESGSESASGDETEVSAPTFDVVRVEPDGSTLIAGQTTPGTQVEIVSGGQVIAKADAGASGDFVAVVEEALKPGDHEIVLRAVGEGNASTQSEEVATISVPKDDPAELLVMVTKPGEASRILAKPETDAAGQETVVAAAESEKTQQDGDAGTGVAEKPAQSQSETQAASEEPKQEPETKTAMAEETADAAPAGDVSEQEGGEQKVPAAQSDDGAVQSDGEQTAVAASAEDGNAQTAASAETGDAPKAEPETAASDKAETEVAMAPAEAAADENETEKSGAVAALPQTTLRIDAVEIEGGRIFVAGSSTPGGEVRVYADGEPIGSSTVSESGRFLVEADKDLAVGDHIIGADLIMQAGDAPSLRVAVPFTRPEGQMVAAVASEEPEENTSAAGQASAATGEATDSAAVEAADTPSAAPAEETGSASADESAEKSNNQQVAETSSSSDQQAETANNATTETEETVAQAEAAPATDTAQADAQSQVIEQGSADDSTADASESTDQPTVIASAEAQDDAAPTVVQPALEPRDSSVIIRRGDTLWQISRRIYGRGVRYTTIYLANADQIRNPDKIEPGQIFMVPDEPLENSEELHRQRIRSR
ncbi:LysM peptidoglycan-binding domain-containing protein [Hoeflea poritis]|uniref:LysM peptidoglycan-binding domain-containing protein n=1 Tax=Hoeflea poritis TaxID=2993659 RepID=A0ABT4VQE6_9HYPH|nr:LysM peptidoglycan-binding domain-containing protein [Hoeflea poritis]MDA4846927.1 LysM peptidoglycan-binding domain-containing protein [Hoeflea poritis]